MLRALFRWVEDSGRGQGHKPDAPAKAPFAGASGSTGQTTTLVTPSDKPIVSLAALLELAQWCQQHRLTLPEESPPCAANPAARRPPAASRTPPSQLSAPLAAVGIRPPAAPARPAH